MKKYIFPHVILFFIFFNFSNANAQFILLDQSFDASNFPNWTSYKVSGTSNWVQNNSTEARINAIANTSAETWLISTPVNMLGSAPPQLSFDYKWQFGSNTYNFIDVLVSTNYTGTGNPNIATWTSLTASATWATGNTYTNSGKISLASYYSASKLYVAFRMKATANALSTRNHYLDNILITATTSTYSSDIDKIYNNLYELALTNPTASSVNTLCRQLLNTGAFSNINYSSTSNIKTHLTRLNDIASAYSNPSSTLFNVDSLKQNFYAGLSFWVQINHQTSNWYDRHISYTMSLWQSLVIMAPQLRAERPALLDSTINYLYWGYQLDNYMESANGVNKINGAFPAAVVERNVPYILRMQKQMIEHIDFQNIGEGIEVDYMFGAHSATGRQAYLLNYGEQYFLSVIFYMRATDATFASVGANQVTQIENLFIKGVQWPIYTNANDPSMSGRFNQITRGLGGYKTYIANFLTLNTPQKTELLLVQKRINSQVTDAEKLIGNRMFWRFDYMIHRRANYFSAHRLSSTRTVAGESGNGAGNFNFYNGSGVNYIYRTGKEFSDSLFSFGFNYRQYPGTTVEQDTATLPIITWGVGALNGNAFAGGASDGDVGAMGFKYVKRNVYAYKSTFFFDGEMVSLGAGITRKSGTANVYTTLNQCNLNGTVSYKSGNIISQVNNSTKSVSNPSWIWHDSILYEPLTNQNYIIQSEKRTNNQEVFTTIIDHGLNPSQAKYAYIIKPNISLASANTYVADTNLQVVQNDTLIQAVTNFSTGSTQAVFYKAGSFKLKNGLEFTVNQPCVLLYNVKGTSVNVSVANPMCESSNPTSVTVTINKELTGSNTVWNGVLSTITFALPQGDYAGQSVTYQLAIENCSEIQASATDGNLPANALDNNTATRWSALGDGQWIQLCLGTPEFVTGVDISFFSGDTRASKFDIQLSNDDVIFTTVASNLHSSGKSLLAETFNIIPQQAKFVRIIGRGNTQSLWNSYTEIRANLGALTGVENGLSSENLVYPNPTSQYLFVKENVTKIELINICGEKQLFENVNDKVNISNLDAGIYLVKIFTNSNQVLTSKISIVK